MSLHADEQASFDIPENACDSHFHVFGPQDRYPTAAAQLRYEPPDAPLSDYLQLAARLHLERQVFVQPSAYGRDNRCMLDAMRELGPERSRGIVDVDEDVPDAVLAEMDALGVRGVRINVSPIHPVSTGLADEMTSRIERLAARCAEMGWHLDFLLPGWLTAELLPVMRRLELPYSLAHLGMNLARDGVNAPGFQSLLSLLKQGESKAYVKFTGIYRMSKVPGYVDVDPLAMALIDAAPDRLIWGSDYPHLSFGDKSSVELFNLLGRWTASDELRKKILVQNPAMLLGIEGQGGRAERPVPKLTNQGFQMSEHIRVALVEPGTRPELAEIEDRIMGQRGRVSLLYQVLLNSGPIASGWERMLTAVRNETGLSDAHRELIILRVAVLNGAAFEFEAHQPIAERAGVPLRKIEATRHPTLSDAFTEEEALLLSLTDAITRCILVSDELMDRLKARYDDKMVVEIVATVAAYNMVSRFLVALNVKH